MVVAANPGNFDPVENFEDFFRFYQQEPNKFKIREQIHDLYSSGGNSITFEYEDLLDYDPKLATELRENPEKTLEDAVNALKNLLRIEAGGVIDESLDYFVRVDTATSQLAVTLRGLRAEHIDKLVYIRGILVRMTPIKPQIVTATFECQDCGHQFGVDQYDTVLLKPAKCLNPGCNNKTHFILVSKDSKFIDWQSLHIQESTEALPAGRIPRAIQAILTHDLVDRARPGDHVKIMGIYRSIPQENARGAKSTIFKTFVHANNIECKADETEEAHASDEELEEIFRLAKEPLIQKKIGRSVAPSIKGYEHVKMACALSLFSGVAKHKADGGHIRGDIHVLVVGDPGTGKSQILQAAIRLAPRGLYTSGKGSSAAGLTAAVVKDSDTGGMSLEAGAIVLADGGTAGIDEFDKMRNEDRTAIHEAMEQQSYHYNTEILATNGDRITIGSFIDDLMARNAVDVIPGINCEILPYDQLSLFSTDFQKVNKVHTDRISRHSAPDHFYRFTFTNGRDIIVTPEHPMYVFRENSLTPIPADNCQIGDFVPIPRFLPNSSLPVSLERNEGIPYRNAKQISFPNQISPELARILGYFVTEGHSFRGSAVEIGFSNTNETLLNDFQSLMLNTFGLSPNINHRNDGLVTLRYLSVELYMWVRTNFPEVIALARKKRIPAKILGASVELAKGFLQCAFKGDGSLESTSICYRTASRGLSEDYQDLLLKLGIQTRIVIDTNNQSYKVYIRGQSLVKFFQDVIEEDDPRFQQFQELIEPDIIKTHHHDIFPTDIIIQIIHLKKILGMPYDGFFYRHLQKGHGVTRNILENNIKSIREKVTIVKQNLDKNVDVQELREKIGYSKKYLCQISGYPNRNIEYYENGGYPKEKRSEMKRNIFNSIRSQIEHAESEIEVFENLMNADILWDRIKKIDIIPNDGENYTPWVYDITVEPSHTFIAQGVVLHNTVSIAKAGIVATLNARTSIIAAANPHLGRYNPWKTASENIRLSPPILSRFDLIFVIIDKPDPTTDRDIAEFILDLHMNAETMKTCEPNDGEQGLSIVTTPDIIPGLLLKKFIQYARNHCFPRLTPKAKQKILDFYLKMRGNGGEDNAAVGMVARNLEGIIRLCEAHAKMALQDTIEDENVDEILELVTRSLKDTGYDKETDTFDIDRIMTGVSRTQVNRISKVQEILKDMEEENGGKPVELEQLKERLELEGMTKEAIEEALKTLKREGDVIFPKNNLIKSTKNTGKF
ncbi:MAG TPA: LAGLIDADG family homing endonuclease [Candidatus Lokiarchaeia archaeon]|nr:LAGLIDADG family homing endonuclease [Candidatus Lokiarchaeia archaeon]